MLDKGKKEEEKKPELQASLEEKVTK